MNSEPDNVVQALNDAERTAEQQALAEAIAPATAVDAAADAAMPVAEVTAEATPDAAPDAAPETAAAPQQTEMPFAIVEGEPYTEIPRDLYIPPDALQVFLEAFEGPLDLLLYLIRKQNLDILDIPIAEITKQYMSYIDVMQDLQLELAGEYLLMAAMLAEIKSRMLLPRPKSEDGQEEEDPRAELVRRLQEYERFKKAADDLDQLKRMDRDVMPAMVELTERRVTQRLPDVTLSEMLKAFREVVKRSEHFTHHQIQREPLSQRQRMTEILDLLAQNEFLDFVRLFRPEEGRMGVTVTFISILELMKEGLIDIVQTEPYAPLHVRKATRRRDEADAVSDASVDADAANAAALAQPELPDENVMDDEPEDVSTEADAADAGASETAVSEAGSPDAETLEDTGAITHASADEQTDAAAELMTGVVTEAEAALADETHHVDEMPLSDVGGIAPSETDAPVPVDSDVASAEVVASQTVTEQTVPDAESAAAGADTLTEAEQSDSVARTE